MFGQDRDSLRRFFLDAWRKRQADDPLEPLERLIAEVVAQHPEYQALLTDPERALSAEFTPEAGQSNPFLHMGMHITLAEQLASDRPSGIRVIYRRLAPEGADRHQVEHRMMECLGLVLWEAQRDGRAPDEKAYLDCLRRLLQ